VFFIGPMFVIAESLTERLSRKKTRTKRRERSPAECMRAEATNCARHVIFD
jgi:hypothetical protein